MDMEADMSAVIIARSDQINADDLIAGPLTITITGVAINAGTEQPVSIRFAENDSKVFRPCKTVSRVLVAAWGPDAKQYVGRSATLYRDPKVKWGGLEVGGIRISHLSHIERDMTVVLKETRANSKPVTIKPLVKAAPPAPKQPAAGFAAKWATTWRGRIADPDVRAATLAAQWAAPANKTALDKATAEDPALAAAVGAEVAAAIDAEADA